MENQYGYVGPVLEIEFKSLNNEELHKDILNTMHNTFKGMPDYVDSNIVVSESYDNGNIAGVYVCLDDVKDKDTLTSKLSELGVNINETYKKSMEEKK